MIMYLEPHHGWRYAHELRELHGEAFFIISPGQIYLYVSNADAINQITTRRNQFSKALEIYEIINIFGKSILTTEKEEWKRHKKVVAPAFSEKNNVLVWRETIKQTNGMLKFWSRTKGSDDENLKVENTAPDTAVLTLHIISVAAYGMSQSWEGDDEEQLGDDLVHGFSTARLEGNHELMFKNALSVFLHGIIWAALAPMWVYEKSPFKIHKKWYQSYIECGNYFNELFDHQLQIIERGGADDTETTAIIGSLVAATQTDPSNSSKMMLTKQEVIADSFILLFAGHETTGNTIHFIFLFLAISISSQGQLQSTLDTLLSNRSSNSWNYESDFPALFNSFVGAVINETLRLMQPVTDVPKVNRESQQINVDGKMVTIPANTFTHLNIVGVHRTPRYWPCKKSEISDKDHDLDDFIPTRWLPGYETNSNDKASPDNSSEGLLFVPRKGAFIPFSEGARGCPGKRFAQVEMVAALAAIFKEWSVELDVERWASDDEVEKMGVDGRKVIYEKAMQRARKLIKESETVITLQMVGESVPLRKYPRTPTQTEPQGYESFITRKNSLESQSGQLIGQTHYIYN
ncbi:hypothetical protein NHQ30_002709 [Ciborinia camelliae]|nr:hypothetical protein NHQ30_002709 [Ciborinia camelliae]